MAAIGMADLLTPGRVLPRLRVRDAAGLSRALAAPIARDAGVAAEAIVREMQFAGDLPPFMPRGGVSMLHALVPALPRPMAAFARLHPPVNLHADDGCATDLAILLASPADRPQDHLRALACIARRLRRRDVLARLRSGYSRDLAYVVLTRDDWTGGADAPPRAEQLTNRK